MPSPFRQLRKLLLLTALLFSYHSTASVRATGVSAFYRPSNVQQPAFFGEATPNPQHGNPSSGIVNDSTFTRSSPADASSKFPQEHQQKETVALALASDTTHSRSIASSRVLSSTSCQVLGSAGGTMQPAALLLSTTSVIPCYRFASPRVVVVGNNSWSTKLSLTGGTTGFSSAAVVDLEQRIFGVFITEGSSLSLQGLVLSGATLPTSRLVAEGVTPPAPAMFMIQQGASLSITNCTLTTTASRLEQYTAWLQQAAVAVAPVAPSTSSTSANGSSIATSDKSSSLPQPPPPVTYTPGYDSAGRQTVLITSLQWGGISITNTLVVASEAEVDTLIPSQRFREVPEIQVDDFDQFLRAFRTVAEAGPAALTLPPQGLILDPQRWPTNITIIDGPVIVQGSAQWPGLWPRPLLDFNYTTYLAKLSPGQGLMFRGLTLTNLCLGMTSVGPSARAMYMVELASYANEGMAVRLEQVTLEASPEDTRARPIVMSLLDAEPVFGGAYANMLAGGRPCPGHMLQLNQTHFSVTHDPCIGRPDPSVAVNLTQTYVLPSGGGLFQQKQVYCSGYSKGATVAPEPFWVMTNTRELWTVLLRFSLYSTVPSLVDMSRWLAPATAFITNDLEDLGQVWRSKEQSGQPLKTLGVHTLLQGPYAPLVFGGDVPIVTLDMGNVTALLQLVDYSTGGTILYIHRLRFKGLVAVGSSSGGGSSSSGGAYDSGPAAALWAFKFNRTQGSSSQLRLHNVSLVLPAPEFAAWLRVAVSVSGVAPNLGGATAAADGNTDGVSSDGVLSPEASASVDEELDMSLEAGLLDLQISWALPSALHLTSLQGWGVAALELRLEPDTPLAPGMLPPGLEALAPRTPQPAPPPEPLSSGPQSMGPAGGEGGSGSSGGSSGSSGTTPNGTNPGFASQSPSLTSGPEADPGAGGSPSDPSSKSSSFPAWGVAVIASVGGVAVLAILVAVAVMRTAKRRRSVDPSSKPSTLDLDPVLHGHGKAATAGSPTLAHQLHQDTCEQDADPDLHPEVSILGMMRPADPRHHRSAFSRFSYGFSSESNSLSNFNTTMITRPSVAPTSATNLESNVSYLTATSSHNSGANAVSPPADVAHLSPAAGCICQRPSLPQFLESRHRLVHSGEGPADSAAEPAGATATAATACVTTTAAANMAYAADVAPAPASETSPLDLSLARSGEAASSAAGGECVTNSGVLLAPGRDGAEGPLGRPQTPRRERSRRQRPQQLKNAASGSGDSASASACLSSSNHTSTITATSASCGGSRLAPGANLPPSLGQEIRSIQASLPVAGEADRLQLLEPIGSGGYGTVYRGVWRGLDVAIKTVLFQDASPPSAADIAVARGHLATSTGRSSGSASAQGPMSLDRETSAGIAGFSGSAGARTAPASPAPAPSPAALGRVATAQEVRKQAVLREAAVCSRVDHPNVVATYHYHIAQVQLSSDPYGPAACPGELQVVRDMSGCRDCKLYIVQELCDASLLEALTQGLLHVPLSPGFNVLDPAPAPPVLDPDSEDRDSTQLQPLQATRHPELGMCLTLLADVARGVAYLHSLGVVHGDLTPSNVMLRAVATQQPPQHPGRPHMTVVAKVSDFGLCQLLDPSQTHVSNQQQQQQQGTPFYMAPEVTARHQVTKASDVYSFGVIMWVVLTGQPPGLHLPDGSLVPHPHLGKLPKGLLSADQAGADMAPRVQSIISRCLGESPAARPAMQGCVDELQSMGDMVL